MITVNTLQKNENRRRKNRHADLLRRQLCQPRLMKPGWKCLLVGDSLGMVMQGADSTLPVTLEEMAYHVRCVARGARNALIIGDMPFGSYQESPQQAFASAAKLMQAGAHMVKLEGGAFMADATRLG